MSIPNSLRHRLLGTSGLAMLAIVGVLSMHGVDPASLGLDHPEHHVSLAAANSPDDVSLGACLFALSLGGLLAVTRLGWRPQVVLRPASRLAVSLGRSNDAVAGRHRLISLGVIRV